MGGITEMTIGLSHFLTVAAILFVLGIFGIFLNRKNVIVILMSVELILLSVNLNLVAFSAHLNDLAGQVFTMFILTVAAAEAANAAAAAEAVRGHLSQLNAHQRATVVCGNALQWQGAPFDVVFVDPPYSSDLGGIALEHLVHEGLLANDARIYLEMERNQASPPIPASLEVIRDKVAGNVRYQLLAVADNVCL